MSGTGPAGSTPPRAWFARPALDVARDLLDARLTVRRADGTVTVRLTEVEAYGGADDPGSHAYRGRTARNAVMFGPPGHLYVYRHLGLHHCANIVTGPVGRPSAVLLRAGEVVDGDAAARARRVSSGVVRRDVDLARGPARLVVALGLTGADDGLDLLGADVGIAPAADPPADVAVGGRVGVSGPGGDPARFPWRLWLAGDPAVSAYRRG
ncbi:DNA-3-methyladenine glycosylase [Isoptericola sp. b490]|uniref:DNA-3-methyladenine glycosylase n=1 Tax=Actinotalea lenta TaxID=3064654 RepID=UPI0027129072|nr:DNA-3-methyladenine glycosylase [Isoptericola sp. b490]MDO8120865.1 DNA-3-methyladenine glycosylase [Isoptericola sp. b490]